MRKSAAPLTSFIIIENDIVSEIYRNEFSSSDEILNFVNIIVSSPENEHWNKANLKVLD